MPVFLGLSLTSRTTGWKPVPPPSTHPESLDADTALACALPASGTRPGREEGTQGGRVVGVEIEDDFRGEVPGRGVFLKQRFLLHRGVMGGRDPCGDGARPRRARAP